MAQKEAPLSGNSSPEFCKGVDYAPLEETLSKWRAYATVDEQIGCVVALIGLFIRSLPALLVLGLSDCASKRDAKNIQEKYRREMEKIYSE